MVTIRSVLVGSTLALLLLITPATAAAQSSEVARAALLQQLIGLLEMQIELLQQQLVTQQTLANTTDYQVRQPVFREDSSILESLDGQVIARYDIEDMAIMSSTRRHDQYMDRMKELLPVAYHDYFTELIVFTSSNDQIDAFVETYIPYESQWRYGVHDVVFEDPIDSPINSELLIHEFAHVFSMHEVFSDSDRPQTCHEFFGESGCVAANTIYGKFLAEFWDTSKLDQVVANQTARNREREVTRFYDRNQDSFVNSYAATNPAEDFAESFAYFVLYDDKSFGLIADEKVQFFNWFSKSRSLKEEILNDL